MEKELTKKGPVLDRRGRPIPGFSRRSTRVYDRRAIKAPPWRIKEWDYYHISNNHLCLQMTIGHASYAGQVSLMLFHFRDGKKYLDLSRTIPLPFHSFHMPADAEQDHHLYYDKNGIYMSFDVKDGIRTLTCFWDGVEASVKLKRVNPDSLVITLPFDECEHAFYYNHKINCMTAEGTVRVGAQEWKFDCADSFGLLDWGRGVWPFHNEWYWSNATGRLGEEMFGFNLGCGFGNSDTASENMLFYQGRSHKLGRVDFTLGKRYMDPWHLTDREGRLDLWLTPVYDRTTKVKVLWVNNCCHQMFGEFRGTVVLDSGERLEVKDIVSFAEHAQNNW